MPTSKSSPAVYAKAITSLIGAVLTALAGIYGDADWYPVAMAVITALATYAVPNAVAYSGPDTTGTAGDPSRGTTYGGTL